MNTETVKEDLVYSIAKIEPNGSPTRRRARLPRGNAGYGSFLISDSCYPDKHCGEMVVVRFDPEDQYCTIVDLPEDQPKPVSPLCGTWAKEFDETFAIPAAVFAHGLVDTSWHNDMCPSFTWPGEEASENGPSMFVDHWLQQLRESDGGKRYTVYMREGGSVTFPSTPEPFETDVLSEALAKMDEWRNGLPFIGPRFVWITPAMLEEYKDIADVSARAQLGQYLLWDRQEKKPVATIFAEYAQAVCLEVEVNDDGKGSAQFNAPFTALEAFMNDLSDEAFKSEGMTPTKPQYRKR